MKKLLCFLSVAIIVTVAILGTAYAYPTLPAPEWKIKFQNYEDFNPDLVPARTVLQDDGSGGYNLISSTPAILNPEGYPPGVNSEDNWGIAQVTSILEGIGSTATPHWAFDDDNYEVYAIFGGLNVTNWNETVYLDTSGNEVTSSGTFETGAANMLADGTTPVTPFIDFYLWDEGAGDFMKWAVVAAQGLAGRTGAYDYNGITNGSAQLLVSFDFVSGIDSLDPNVLTSGTASGDNPPTGKGTGYANVDYSKVGAWTNTITQGYWPTAFGDRDAKLVFNFDTRSTVADWPLESDDPFEGGAVPEPATIMLLGFGLLGIAAVGRKR